MTLLHGVSLAFLADIILIRLHHHQQLNVTDEWQVECDQRRVSEFIIQLGDTCRKTSTGNLSGNGTWSISSQYSIVAGLTPTSTLISKL